MKKKIIAIILAVAIIGGGIALYLTRDKTDPTDTEELYRQNVASVAYENTIEDAMPQTEIYDLIKGHFDSKLPKGKTEKKAILIGYDGCRADILAEIDKQNSAIAHLTSQGAPLKLAYCGGVNYPEVNTQYTSTAPGWCSILTGKWADEHGITGNDITKTTEHKTLLISLTEEKVIDSAVFATRWKGHFSRKNATYLEEMDYCGANGLDVTYTLCENDDASHLYVMDEVARKNCADFIFSIYEPTDGTGHSKGFSFNNPLYKEAFQKEDAMALEVINGIKNRDTYEKEDWLFIITSDHGGIGTNHGKQSIQERMTFVVANKDF